MQLNSTYEILGLIGEGGQSEIYRGVNIHTRDPVAIKVIRPEMLRDADAMALFRREASILFALHDEAIVRYFAYSFDPAVRRDYLAMELVEGESLKQRLASGPLSLEDVMALKTRVARALAAAHRLGVVHRDISPDNVILPGGDVRAAKIIDFGIAKAALDKAGTIIGDGFAGKELYVSPEQVSSGDVTFKSDIYSLGLVLAEALRGRPLDMGGSMADIVEKRRRVPDLSDIDPAIRGLLRSMLQPSPGDRPASMVEVAEWRRDEGADFAIPPSPKAARAGGGGRLAAAVGALLLLVGLAATAFVFRSDMAALVASFSETRPETPAVASNAPDRQGVGAATATPTPRPATPSPSRAAEAPKPVPSAAPSPRVEASPPSPATPTPAPSPKVGSASPSPRAEASSAAPSPSASPTPSRVATDVPKPRAVTPEPSISPTPSNSPGAPVDPERIARFVRDYDGGDCVLVRAPPGSHAKDGFAVVGADRTAASKFDDAFRKALGADPHSHGVVIDKTECATLDLMNRGDESLPPAPRVELESSVVSPKAPLAGVVTGLAGRNFKLLVVKDDGVTIPISAAQTSPDSATFRLAFREIDPEDVGHTLAVLAVASNKPLAVIADIIARRLPGGPLKADDLVGRLQEDWSSAGAAADVQFVTLSR